MVTPATPATAPAATLMPTMTLAVVTLTATMTGAAATMTAVGTKKEEDEGKVKSFLSPNKKGLFWKMKKKISF